LHDLLERALQIVRLGDDLPHVLEEREARFSAPWPPLGAGGGVGASGTIRLRPSHVVDALSFRSLRQVGR
jgi:hypothetical protein